MGRKKVITESMTQEEKFDLCVNESALLEKGEFVPEIDNLNEETVADVMFKVLHEWDMATDSLNKIIYVDDKQIKQMKSRIEEVGAVDE